jgi:hypothetical protein
VIGRHAQDIAGETVGSAGERLEGIAVPGRSGEHRPRLRIEPERQVQRAGECELALEAREQGVALQEHSREVAWRCELEVRAGACGREERREKSDFPGRETGGGCNRRELRVRDDVRECSALDNAAVRVERPWELGGVARGRRRRRNENEGRVAEMPECLGLDREHVARLDEQALRGADERDAHGVRPLACANDSAGNSGEECAETDSSMPSCGWKQTVSSGSEGTKSWFGALQGREMKAAVGAAGGATSGIDGVENASSANAKDVRMRM